MSQEDYETAFAVYQTEFGRDSSISKYNDVNFNTIKTTITALSHYMEHNDPNILEPSYRINYNLLSLQPITKETKKFYDFKVDELCIDKSILASKIRLNLEIIRLLDEGLEKHNSLIIGSEIFTQTSYRSPYLYKGITSVATPTHILDEKGIIKPDSSIDIGSYNSASTNLFVSLEFSHDDRNPGNLFIITEIKRNIKGFDFPKFLIDDVVDKSKYPHKNQYLYLQEQEILFKRNLRLSKINYLGRIAGYHDDIGSINTALSQLRYCDDLLICSDGCIYNKQGDSICSVNLLFEAGYVKLADVIEGDITTYLKGNARKYRNTKVYICSLSDPIYEADIQQKRNYKPLFGVVKKENDSKVHPEIPRLNIARIDQEISNESPEMKAKKTEPITLSINPTTTFEIPDNSAEDISISMSELSKLSRLSNPDKASIAIKPFHKSYFERLPEDSESSRASAKSYFFKHTVFKYYDNKDKPSISKDAAKNKNIIDDLLGFTTVLKDTITKLESGKESMSLQRKFSEFILIPSACRTQLGGKNKKITKKDIIININKLVSNIKGLNKLNKKELENLYNYLNELYQYKKYELINKFKSCDLNKNMNKSKMIYLIYLQSKYNKSI
jgi:hypothetical protein